MLKNVQCANFASERRGWQIELPAGSIMELIMLLANHESDTTKLPCAVYTRRPFFYFRGPWNGPRSGDRAHPASERHRNTRSDIGRRRFVSDAAGTARLSGSFRALLFLRVGAPCFARSGTR